jgi:cation transport regulator ChaC
VGSNPAKVDGFLRAIKISDTTSFGREVQPGVSCTFTAGKRISPHKKR